jgi:plasmid stability protein
MSKTIQIRDVDDETYRTLRRRAADQDMSLSAYLRKQFDDMASGPTMAELFAETSKRARDRRRLGKEIDRDAIVRIQREIRDGVDSE